MKISDEKQNYILWAIVIVLSFVVLNLAVKKSRSEQSADLYAGTVRSLRESVERLEKQVKRFDDDNWRDVVPHIRDVSKEMRWKLNELDQEVREAIRNEEERDESSRY